MAAVLAALVPTATFAQTANDGRESFQPSAFVGRELDNFAPNVIAGYANPEAAGQQWSWVGGFDFQFRAIGKSTSDRQLWLFGETLHGVRSADVDCTASDKPAICANVLDPATVATFKPGQALQFVLDHASSLEAYAGARYEFLTLQKGPSRSNTLAKLYAVARLGVMMLDGATTANLLKKDNTTTAVTLQVNRAYRAYHFGAGLLIPKGPFDNSYLEIGFGRTDLFTPDDLNPWRRLKIDGYLSVPFPGVKDPKWPKWFVQLYSDFDPTHKTADSIQTFYGIDIDVLRLFGQ
jgi:hypothetical protein